MYHGAMSNPSTRTRREAPREGAFEAEAGAAHPVAVALANVRHRFGALTRVQQVVSMFAAILAVAVVVVGAIFIGTWVTGGFTPPPRTEAERAVIVALEDLGRAESDAASRGANPDTSAAVIDATARLVVAEVAAGRVDSALSRANDLAPRAASSATALYACAVAFRAEGSDGYRSRALDLLAVAATMLDGVEPEVARSILAEYGQALGDTGDAEGAYEQLLAAAKVAPASAELFAEVGRMAEEMDRPYDAAYAYEAAAVFDPLMAAATEGRARLRKAAPADAARAAAAVAEEYGAGHE